MTGSSVRIGLVMAALCAMVLLIGIYEPRVVFAKTRSTRYHWLFTVTGIPRKGDYVNVEVRYPLLDPMKAVLLTKRVGCMPGERLEFLRGEHYCDGVLLDRVLARDSKGAPLAPFAWNGPIPWGKVFVVGDNPRSLDSRYFGFVDVAGLQRLWPLF